MPKTPLKPLVKLIWLQKSRTCLKMERFWTDLVGMKTFFDTLIDQLEKDIVGKRAFTSQHAEEPTFTSVEEPDVIAQLIGRTTTLNQQNYKFSPYKKLEKPLPPHRLNEDQKKAHDFFKIHGFNLSPRFSLRELKSTYKKAALKLHPDLGGKPEQFQNLKLNFETLLQVFIF